MPPASAVIHRLIVKIIVKSARNGCHRRPIMARPPGFNTREASFRNSIGRNSFGNGQLMSVRCNVDIRKQQNVGGDDIGPEMLDVGSPAAEFENATFRPDIEQLPVKIPV
jgi:hypothetical protein